MTGGRVRVEFRYLGARLGHSRYGMCRREEVAVRYVEESELESVFEQFRSSHEVIEVRVRR